MSEVDDIRRRLLADAFLYDDPASYAAGVLASFRELAPAGEQAPSPPPAATGPAARAQ